VTIEELDACAARVMRNMDNWWLESWWPNVRPYFIRTEVTE